MGFSKYRKQTKIELMHIAHSWNWQIKDAEDRLIGNSTESFETEKECLDNLSTLAHDIMIYVKAALIR